jgi:hypothetical protein
MFTGRSEISGHSFRDWFSSYQERRQKIGLGIHEETLAEVYGTLPGKIIYYSQEICMRILSFES